MDWPKNMIIIDIKSHKNVHLKNTVNSNKDLLGYEL